MDQVSSTAEAAPGERAAERHAPLPYLMLVLLAALPLLIATALLQLLGPLGEPLSKTEMTILQSVLTDEPFLPGALTLIGVLAAHVCICLGGIALGWALLKRHYGSWRIPALLSAVGAAMAASLLIVGSIKALGPQLAPYQLSYFYFVELYRGTGAEASFLQPRTIGLDPLTLAVIIPITLGIIGIPLLMGAMLSHAQSLGRPPQPPNEAFEARLHFTYDRLKRCTYILSAGLVTSTVAASLFFHLPSKISAESLPGAPSAITQQFTPNRVRPFLEQARLAGRLSDLRESELKALRGKFDAFAAELSIFWGAVFTLTLAVAAGVPIVLLHQKMLAYTEYQDPLVGRTALKRLEKAGLVSQWQDQLKLLMALMAPLASGPIANFVQATAGP